MLEHMPNTSVVLFDLDMRARVIVGDDVGSGLEAGADPRAPLADVFPPAQAEVLARHCEAALRGESRSIEYAGAAGRDLWLRVVPVREGSAITGGMAISQDISGRRRAERGQELAEGTRRLMIDAMNEAYVAIDGEGTVIDWNKRATQLFGFTREEAIGRRTTDLIIPAEDHDQFDELIDNFVRPGHSGRTLDLRAERNAVHKEGHVFPVELAAATLDRDGVTSLHTFMHDISERRRARAEAKANAADVAAIAEATGALARSTEPEEAREVICRAAKEIAGASSAILFEPDASGTGLLSTAAVGAEASGEVRPFVGRTSGAVKTFVANEPMFLPDLAADSTVAQGVLRGAGAISAYWVPVRRGDTPLGVIAVGWTERLTVVPQRVARIMDLVAAEAAVAIERAALLDRLARMARTDDLTGLPNRRAWDHEISREIARARREETPVTVAMVDLDHFKTYNDANGHLAGDRLLKEAAGTWRSVLRATDLIARYGGEEFAIALPGCAQDEAERLIDRLRAVTPGGESCSAGIAEWNGAEHPEQLLGRADRALYEAKQAGRNRTVVA
jgi:diguanylate cyclase (GGDEF)-like protein/PAS domain S-box-containing protein